MQVARSLFWTGAAQWQPDGRHDRRRRCADQRYTSNYLTSIADGGGNTLVNFVYDGTTAGKIARVDTPRGVVGYEFDSVADRTAPGQDGPLLPQAEHDELQHRQRLRHGLSVRRQDRLGLDRPVLPRRAVPDGLDRRARTSSRR